MKQFLPPSYPNKFRTLLAGALMLVFTSPPLVASAFRSVQQTAQSRTITGTITADNGETLPGASILLKGTTTGTVTDADGHYSISLSEDNAILVFSSIG